MRGRLLSSQAVQYRLQLIGEQGHQGLFHIGIVVGDVQHRYGGQGAHIVQRFRLVLVYYTP